MRVHDIAKAKVERKVTLSDPRFCLKEARFRDGAIVELPAGVVDATDFEIGDATRFEISGPFMLDSISIRHPLIVRRRIGYTGKPEAQIVSLKCTAIATGWCSPRKWSGASRARRAGISAWATSFVENSKMARENSDSTTSRKRPSHR